MTGRDSKKGSRSANALAMVAGALIALLAILGFLALVSHRGGAQQPRTAPTLAAAAPPRAQLTVSVWAVAS